MVPRKLPAIIALLFVLPAGCVENKKTAEPTSVTKTEAPSRGTDYSSVKDPYVKWLTGQQQAQSSLPTPLKTLIGAAGVDETVFTQGWSTWNRLPTELVLSWDRSPNLPGGSCPEVMNAVEAAAKQRGFSSVAPEDSSADDSDGSRLREPPEGIETARYSSTDGPASYDIQVKCVPRHSEPKSGCAGACMQDTRLFWKVNLRLQAGPFARLEGGLAQFPPLEAQVMKNLLPGFLKDIVNRADPHSFHCGTWSEQKECTDFTMEVAPKGDQTAWIKDSIEAAKDYGFSYEASDKDPARYALRSYQKCSATSLYHRIRDGRVNVRLAEVIGGSPEDTLAACSQSYKAAGGAPPPPEGATMIMEVPVTTAHLEHLMKLHDCFTEFHKRAGREMARQPWKRGGNYLYFYSTENGKSMPGNPDRLSSGRFAAEFSAFHYPHTGEKTKKYFIRISHNANGLHAQLYCPIDFSYAGGYCDLTFKDDQRKTNTVRLNLADSPVLPSSNRFEELLVAEVNKDYERSLRGLDGMTYCKVLPNGGCMDTPATDEMKKKRRARLEEQHPEELARAKARAEEFYRISLSLYPLNDQNCAVGTRSD